MTLFLSVELNALKIGETPPHIVLKDHLGGTVSGEIWDSSTLRNKVYIVMYIDPDQKEYNVHVENALNRYFKDYPLDSRGSVAIINMKATWSPNVILEPILTYKQKKFPHTVFVKDLQKTLVKKWGLQDDGYHILVFSKKGKLLYSNYKKLSQDDVNDLILLIDNEIKK